jgi:hypothetical protein
MGARNRVEKGCRTGPPGYIGWQSDSLESIPGLLTSLNIPSLAEYAGKGKQRKISMGLLNFSSLLHWGSLKQSNLNQPENCGVNLARQVCSTQLSLICKLLGFKGIDSFVACAGIFELSMRTRN